MIQAKTPEEVDQMKAEEDAAYAEQVAIPQEEAENYNPSSELEDLAGYVRKCWERATDAKRDCQTRMLANQRNYDSTYDPVKLAEIRALGGSEVFIPLTATKCNAAISWLNEIFFRTAGEVPWDIESTPVPDLPESETEMVRQEVLLEVGQVLGQYAAMTGEDPLQLLQKYKPQIIDRIFYKMKDRSDDAIEDLKREIGDQLEEGYWYEEIRKVIQDLVTLEFGCLKGPIYRKEKYFRRELDQMTGTYSNQITDEIKPVFERRSPFQIFPAPNSDSVDSDFIFDLQSYSLKDLYDMIGLEGFNEEEIRRVIQDFKGGILTEWLGVDQAVKNQLHRNTVSSAYEPTDHVDVLEFWGSINGQMLMDWGMEGIDDPDKYYGVCVWLIDRRVIKAMLNPDPMGRKPFHIRSYVNNNDSLTGGKGLATLLESFQQICNAIARAIVNNSAIASGPIVEYNDDRMPTGYDPVIYPWKTIAATNGAMSDAPAVRFYQANPVTDQLIQVFDYFSKLADQYSVPSYAHGDTQIGGAGETASGLSMLMGSADRVIKNVVKNIDELISSSIELLYLFNMTFMEEEFEYVGDVRIVARGSISLLQKEQQSVRRTDLLVATNNPTDLQIMGLGVRKEMLVDTFKSVQMADLARKFPIVDEIDELKQELMMMQQQQMEAEARAEQLAALQNGNGKSGGGSQSAKKPAKADAAGNKAGGPEQRAVPQKNAPQQRPRLSR